MHLSGVDNYRLNVSQITLLRGFGLLILCNYLLLYDVLISPGFSWQRYLAFVAILALEDDLCTGDKPPELLIKKTEIPRRGLLAEDNEVNQQVALEFLEMRGHYVRIAPNGIEALACLENERFNVILMDVQMPYLDGFRATAAIREKEKTTGDHIPIIAMTGYAMKGDRQRCLDAGMDSYICKPIRSQELYDIVETSIASKKNLKIDLAPLLLDNE
jgi:CheY-like chemotaxis protein